MKVAIMAATNRANGRNTQSAPKPTDPAEPATGNNANDILNANDQLNQAASTTATPDLRAELKRVLAGEETDYVLVPFEGLNDNHDVMSTGLKHTKEDGRLYELCKKL